MRQEKVDAASFHFASLTNTYRTQCRYHGNRYRHQDDEDREADTSIALFQQETNHMFTHFEGQQPVGCNFFGWGWGEGSVITDISYCTHHHPTGSQEDDDTEDVDHTWREDAVPCAKQHRFRDKEVWLPPRTIARRLQIEQVILGFIITQQLCRVKNFKGKCERDAT